MWVSKKQKGFTIVELLIVVVVIAILAAISIVSYNGITTRAQNAKIVSTVRQYINIIELYKSDTNEYPNVGADYICLPGTYPATSQFQADSCEYDGVMVINYTSINFSNDLGVMLRTVQPNLPDASYGVTITDYLPSRTNERARGIVYSNDGGWQIRYHLKGTTTCPIGTPDYGIGNNAVTCGYYFAG
jgi:prepilin-type N-terminal cleavage/methylation domain-containing protein